MTPWVHFAVGGDWGPESCKISFQILPLSLDDYFTLTKSFNDPISLFAKGMVILK